ncbi:hypothetical protein G7Z17_g2840 [Cylindrodendrum hubeiense]|uniref:Ankyrin n=1 Tax=Cylindrodendrum hubeiense TaxID=595255 RepID=A0A9P5HGY6_9HYPO|nr:hypothetical protein G7Z17_g2840 [Cylindrodendrum hubeiense]
MAERIVSLKDSTFALCSVINKHLKASGSKHDNDLKALVVELRLLGGSLYSLEQLILELQETEEDVPGPPGSDERSAWPAVDGCELLVQALHSLHTVADPDGLKDAKSSLLGYRSKFGFILGSSESLQDVDLHFCVLGKEPLPQLRRKDQVVDDAPDSPRSISSPIEEDPSPEVLSSWLEILNSPDHNREPAEHAREMASVQSRRLSSPLYQTAAARWPTYAEAHWSDLGPQICSLFQSPGPFNFVQWVLEYARETYPRTFGSLAMSPKSLLELTDALCNQSISMLHMAAALGLPSLCRELLSKGADINDVGLLGSPLFCAFVGPNVLTTRAEPDSWTSLLDSSHAGADRAATIMLLLNKGADCGYKYQWKNAEEISLAGLSLWAALITNNDSIFNVTVASGADIDSTIIQLIRRENFANHGAGSPDRFDADLPFDERQDGGTILHMATEGGHVEIIDSLVKAGASLNATDSEGRTPMMVLEETPVLSKLVLEYGASTTDVDNKGRTIWHLAASTNYADLIKWLQKNDPCKEQNLATKSVVNCTPLDDAFLYVYSLNTLPKGWSQMPPLAARALLAECHTLPPVDSPGSLLRCAVEWGELDLLNDLIRLGCEPDKDNGSLLSCLNLSASDEMVKRVIELSGRTSLVLGNGVAVAETILTNTVFSTRSNNSAFGQPSAHPSCYPKLTESAYGELLTPEVLKARDSRGRGIWARFCDNVLPMLSGPSCVHPQKLRFLSSFIRAAIEYINAEGALEDYEKDTGEWAILRMADRTGFSPCWERWQFPFITGALQDYVRDETKFVESTNGALLLAQAVRRGQESLVDTLISKGVKIHIPRPELMNLSLLEHLITDLSLHGPMLDTLLESLEPLSLVKLQDGIFGALVELIRESHAARILKALLTQKLIDPNEVSADQLDPRTMLQKAIEEGKPDLALLLLDHGADPALSKNGDQAILAAAKKGYVEIFNKVAEVAGSDFNWLCLYDVKGKHQGSPRNGLAPIHLAVNAGSLSCVRALDDFGADLEVQDPNGATPLILAIRQDEEEIFRHLLDAGVDTELDRYGIHIASTIRRAAAGIINEFVADRLGATPLVPYYVPNPLRLGALLADLLQNCLSQSEGVIAKILAYVPKEHLLTAILPCRGCTLLSFAGAHACNNIMLELVERDFGGFITGCSTHWPHGYNALHHACFGLLRQLDPEEPELVETTLIFIRKCLDAYLKEGILWFDVGCTPLHAIVQFGCASHNERFEVRERALRVLLNHLEARADEYWKLVEDAGLSQLFDPVEGEDTATKLKRFVVNMRCYSMDWLDYSGGSLPNALHLLVDGMTTAVAINTDLETTGEIQDGMLHLLIANGIDVNAKDGDSMTALHFACARGNLPMAKILLEAGANPNVRDYTGDAPLSRAIDWGDMELVRSLIEHGADPETFTGLPHLMYKHPNANYVHQIAHLGLDWHATSPGNTSLALMMLAATTFTRTSILNGSGNVDFGRLAAERPPLLNLMFSRNCGPAMVRKVLKRAPQEHRGQILYPDPCTNVRPCCMSIRKGDVAMLEVFLEFGWDFEREGSEEGSALMVACSVGQLNAVKLLVRRGARLSYVTTDSRGQTVVRSAFKAARLYHDVLRWLLVERHQEWNRLGQTDSSPEAPTKLWSGPRKGAHKLTGFDGHYIGAVTNTFEAQVSTLRRITQVRQELANRVVHVTLVE